MVRLSELLYVLGWDIDLLRDRVGEFPQHRDLNCTIKPAESCVYTIGIVEVAEDRIDRIRGGFEHLAGMEYEVFQRVTGVLGLVATKIVRLIT